MDLDDPAVAGGGRPPQLREPLAHDRQGLGGDIGRRAVDLRQAGCGRHQDRLDHHAVEPVAEPQRDRDRARLALGDRAVDDQQGVVGHRRPGPDHDHRDVAGAERAGDLAGDRLTVDLQALVGVERQQRDRIAGRGRRRLGAGAARGGEPGEPGQPEDDTQRRASDHRVQSYRVPGSGTASENRPAASEDTVASGSTASSPLHPLHSSWTDAPAIGSVPSRSSAPWIWIAAGST